MRLLIPALAVLLVLVPVCQAGAPPDDKEKGKDKAAKQTPEEQFQAIQKAYAKQFNDFVEAYRKAKTKEETQKIFDEKYPKPQEYARKFMKLAEEHPTSPAAVDALVWVATVTGYTPDGVKARELLLKDHIKSAKLASIAANLAYSRSPDTEKVLRRIIKASPHQEVKAQATYALASWLHGQGRDEEAKKLFDEVVKNFAAVKTARGGTLGAAARHDIFEIEHLSIGKVAPNITGIDEDGKKFQLNDYRGKVVLLDFWGEW